MPENRLKGARDQRVLLCITGCIAAYKACEVLRGLQKAGCVVRVVMTEDACNFVGKTTFEALTGHPVATTLYDCADTAIPHVSLSGWADLVAVVPCTGNAMAKAAAGIADDAVTSTLLAAGPNKLAIAPAMNVHMWQNPATQANLNLLRARGVRFVLPVSGRLACGDVGEGKLAEVDEIVAQLLAMLAANFAASATLDFPAAPTDEKSLPPRPLSGRHVVVTAGPTQEAIDPVRFIANRSSGKMGYAVAAAAVAAGARVTLVSGPVSIDAPAGADLIRVTCAEEMLQATERAFADADAAVLAAAVADYTPAHPADHKLKKAHERLDRIELVETADILATVSARKGDRVVIGFAAETGNLVANATAKLCSKGCDMIVANDVSRADSAFGSDTDRVSLVDKNGVRELPTLSKTEVATVICDELAALLDERSR